MILVVGWDGACFDLVDPWLAQGELPGLGRLRGSGARRELNSTRPASTFPAWTSFMTAAGPGRHGIVDFTVPSDGYGLRFVNASYRSLPTIWRLASDAGKPLRLAAPAGHLESRALAARTHLPLDSL